MKLYEYVYNYHAMSNFPTIMGVEIEASLHEGTFEVESQYYGYNKIISNDDIGHVNNLGVLYLKEPDGAKAKELFLQYIDSEIDFYMEIIKNLREDRKKILDIG